jgi:hypothetical protein
VTPPKNTRDEMTDLVQQFVDSVGDDFDQMRRAKLFGDRPVGTPPGNWPAPTMAQRKRAGSECRAAARAARNQLREFGTTRLYTTLTELPEARVAWHPVRPEEALPPAPLVVSLVEAQALRVLTTLAAYAYSRFTRPLWDEAIRHNQLRRLNAFAQLEINLWSFAAEGGYPAPPPYTVRYDVARWLWHPTISGAIFCLRCGGELRYSRRGREHLSIGDDPPHETRIGRCRRCSRGREDDWPEQALEPYRQGTWLLKCVHPGCQEVFVGRRHARHCEKHRLSRLTQSAR